MINSVIMGKSLGWFNKNQIYEMKNQIGAVVYSIAFLDEMPEQHVYPFDIEDTIYFGMSGGKKMDFAFDRKNKTTGRGKVYSLFASRIKTHFMHLERYNPKSERKYHLFHEEYMPDLNPHKQLFIHLFVPDDNRVKDFMRRPFISAIESDFILQYGCKFDKLPLMNIDEKYDRTESDTDSVAGQIKDFAIKSNLMEFL